MNRFSELEIKILKEIKSNTILKCDKCEKTGWLKLESGIKECSCRKVFLFIKEMVYARIPREYWGLDIEDVKVGKLVKLEVMRYSKNFSSAKDMGLGFCFLGPNGVGKTTMLAEIGKVAILSRMNVIYTTTQDYISYKQVSDKYNVARIEEEAEIVLLDEIDKPYKKKDSDYVPVQIENLMRKLLPENKIVIIATNWTREEIKNYFGDSVFSIMLRKLKFVSVSGDDISKSLHDEWDEKLTKGSVNYLSDYFVKISRTIERI